MMYRGIWQERGGRGLFPCGPWCPECDGGAEPEFLWPACAPRVLPVSAQRSWRRGIWR